jgi:hypothetical protein
VFFPFPLPDIYYIFCFAVDNNLGFYGMALLFTGITGFLFFLGLWTGLSVTSTTMNSFTVVEQV